MVQQMGTREIGSEECLPFLVMPVDLDLDYVNVPVQHMQAIYRERQKPPNRIQCPTLTTDS